MALVPFRPPLSAPSPPRRPSARGPASPFRPRAEPLEERRLLAAGVLDPGFGSQGLSLQPLPVSPSGAILIDSSLQADGKIVVAFNDGSGDLVVKRFTATGVPDPTFGANGTATTPVASLSTTARARVAIQPDGRIVIVGATQIDTSGGSGQGGLALVRYTTAGVLDPTFGAAGKVVTTGPATAASGIAVQPNGKIVVAASQPGTSTGGGAFAVVRFNTNGSPDASFGSGGTASAPSASTPSTGPLAVQPDGKIVLAGASSVPSASTTPVLVRFTTTGIPDPAFGSSGVANVNTGVVNGLTIQPDGRIVTAAANTLGTFVSSPTVWAVSRILTNGSPDPTFGAGGFVTQTFGNDSSNSFASATDVAVQPDGKILALGYSGPPGAFTSQTAFNLARYNANGILDQSFGSGGRVTTPVGTSDLAARLGLFGNTIVVTGTADANLALLRYVNDIGGTAPTPVQLTASAATALAGQAVTLTATLPAAATGSVVFTNAGVPFVVQPIVNGSATVSLANLTVGDNTLGASYGGDGSSGPGTAAPVTVTVTLPPLPAGAPVFVTGADAGGGPDVKVFAASTGEVLATFFAYLATFTGGVRVAVGDVNADGTADVITAPGPGGPPDIHVYDGKAGTILRSFFAFDPAFGGGLYLAAGDVNGDGFADVVTGADAGGGPNVAIFDGRTITNGQPINLLVNFFPYDPRFTGGVRVAAGDVNADGKADLVCGAGPGGGPNVSVISGADGKTLLGSFFPYDPRFTGGIYMAAGDVDGDGFADVITGTGAGGGPNVAVVSGKDFSLINSFFPYAPAFSGGVRVAAVDRNGDGRDDVVCTPGPGGGPDVRTVNALTGQQLDDFFAYDPRFTAGLFVAAG